MTLTTDPANPATFPAPAAAAPAPTVPSLRRNFSWTLAGNVTYAACQWGVLVVLAKWGSMEAVGQFAWGLAVTAPLMLLANLQLREVQATDARAQFRFGHYLALRLVCLAAAMLAVAGVAAANRSDGRTAAVVVLIGLAKAFDGLADVVYGLFQQRERMKPVSASLAVNGVVTLAAVAAAMLLAHSVVWAAAGSALGSAVALAVVVAQAARGPGAPGALRPAWDRASAGGLLRIGLPLGAVALLISLNTNLPRYFIEHYLGKAMLGAFAAMAYLLVAGTTVTAALAQSCGPRLARYYARGDFRAFRRLLGKMMAIGVVLGVGGLAAALVAGRQVLTLLYRPEYAFASRSFTWLMAAGAVAYVASFLNTAMIVVRAVRPQACLFAVVITVDFLACAALVPAHGLTGAAWGAGLAYCVQLAGAWLIVAAHLRRRRESPPAGEGP